MPKKQHLETTLEMKASGASRSRKRKCWLEWEGSKLYYKDVIWKKINLAETLNWDVKSTERPRFKTALRQGEEQRIVSLKVWSRRRKKSVEIKLKIPGAEFDTWLYWILVSIYKHTDLPLEDKLDRTALKPSRKGKIRARQGMQAFDAFHEVFVAAAEGVEKMNSVSQKRPMISDPFKTGKAVGFSGESGRVRYGKIGRNIGHGGQAWVFELDKILPSPNRGPRSLGRTEPAVIKKQEVNSGDPSSSLINEARILAAIGEHLNIIRLIDAAIINNLVYIFLEKGGPDLKKFVEHIKSDKKRTKKRLTPVQINIIALGIMAGLSHMHRRRIYHFDFKPENVLMFEHYRPKIMDFGMSRTKLLYPGKKIYDYAAGTGTAGYIPPECYEPDAYSKTAHLEQFDSYSAGMTIFKALIGPRYRWAPKEVDSYRKKNALEEIDYWSKQYDNNRKKLDTDGLLMVSHVAWMMIQKDLMHRVTVQDAFKALKGACRERNSGKRALDVCRKWKN